MEQSSDKSPSVRKKKWVARPLVTQCGVCYSPATDVHHYGSVSCYSCRAFFRRTVGSGKEYRFCSKRTGQCVIDSNNRKNCKKCRFEKCLKIGMMQEKVNRRHPPTKKIKKKELKTIKKSLDIGELVDECFVDEKDYCDDVKDERENKNKEEEYPDSDPENFKNLSPTFNLTFEEDFKIHELMVRKENLFEEFYNIFLEFPNFVSLWKRFLFQIQTCSPVIQSGVPADSYDCNMKNMVRDNFVKGGLVRHALEMFDEFKYVPDHVKTETIEFSLTVLQICIRSYLSANKDKPTLIDQHFAAGTYNKAFQTAYDKVYPGDRFAVQSFDPLQLDIFTTPWAVNYDEEVFFKKTVTVLGSIVKDDVKLGTLFMILVLATPGAALSVEAQADPSLKKVQSDISLLMYRYLKNKLADPDEASRVTNSLLMLIPDLHISRSIHLFRRIALP
eukprot:TRINITY_DN8746_c0_g1_i1.p1 TRINITY_DN8746_c0_g1~~TRINITY_DN8746_c0_g1_i1.p1  ORF type:complete len:445 (+),score=140.52 TRINITY_DN8746_c0_g1_i1:23-1357(+)